MPISLIFGGHGAIGSAIAREFRTRKWDTITAGRRAKLGQNDCRARHIMCDVRSREDVKQVFDSNCFASEQPRCVVYAIGLAPDVEIPLAEYPLDRWRNTFETYVTGALTVFQQYVKRAPNHGHLVIISSAITRFTAETLPPFYAGHYAAAKAGLDELCKWMRREAHSRNLLLSRIAPAAVDTPAHRSARGPFKAARLIPLSIVANRIADSVVWGKELDEEIFPDLDTKAS